MTKALALDLCCGKGGWTKGLLAVGYHVLGYDTERWEGYPGELIQMDVRKFDASDLRGRVSLVVASPPCQEFSYRSFPFKRCRELAEKVPPDKSIWEACERIAKECNAPLVLENVRGVQKYMEKAKAHYGSFYLWGDVPAILPIGKPTKGFEHNYDGRSKCKNFTNGNERLKKFAGEYERKNGVSKLISRKEWSANAAMIPFELSYWIGTVFYPKEKKNGTYEAMKKEGIKCK